MNKNKDNTTMWIIGGIILVLLLIGGGIGIWYYMKKNVTITISPLNTTAAQGDKIPFNAIVKEMSGKSINTQVTWKTSDSSLGIIDSNGLFTALGNTGTVTVTATSVENTSVSATSTVTLEMAIPDYAKVNHKITDDDPLYSKDQQYHATTLRNGKFCIRRKDSTDVWCSFPNKPDGNYFSRVQEDGNFCTYLEPETGKPLGSSIWCSTVLSDTKNNYVIMQDNGKLCTHKGSDPNDDKGELWCAP